MIRIDRGVLHWPVALAALVWIGAFAWIRPLMLPDEGRYVGVAWEMVRSGDWITPTLNGLPFFHKPPLFYWITAASLSVFGLHEWAARLAPLLAVWAASLSMAAFVQRWWGPKSAIVALLVMLTQPLLYLGGQFANLDMLVACCITISIVAAAHTVLLRETTGGKATGYLLTAYAAAGFGILAKGLIGVVLPGLVITVWLLVTGRWRAWLALVSGPGVLVFAAVAVPWFAAMQWEFDGFLDYFFGEHHFRRFTSTTFNNPQPVWIYPAVLAVFCAPYLPWLGPAMRSLASRGLANSRDGRHAIRVLLWVWVVCIVGFFSIPNSKLLGYILPAVPALAVIFSDGIERITSHHPSRWRWAAASGALCMVLCAVAIALTVVRPSGSTKPLGQALGAQMVAGDPVVQLGTYYFDLPFYAGLREPTVVAHAWAEIRARRGDGWAKELSDAGRFDPKQAEANLIEPAQVIALACQSAVSWIVADVDAPRTYSYLQQARMVVSVKGIALWKLDRSEPTLNGALGCSQTPSAD